MGTQTETGLVIVTGGLSGIGAAAAHALSDRGRRVIVIDLAAAKTAQPETPSNVVTHDEPVDVSDEVMVACSCETIERRHGAVSGLVNAAGILGKMHPPDRLALADWDRELAVDLRGTFLMCREIGTRMCQRQRGAIVNVASVVGMLSAPVHGYAPAKAGVISLTATLAAEWGPFGVRVNCVSPDFTETPALARGFDTGALNRDNLKGAAALRRLVDPKEVAAAIVWLLSDEASGVTGVNLPVDAGFLVGVPWQPYGGLRGPSTN